MLDSRYVHLHEALGLGVMWLRRGAKIINTARTPASVQAAQPNSETKNHNEPAKSGGASRLAILQRVNSQTLHQAQNTPQAETPTQPIAPITMPHALDLSHQQTQSNSVPKAKIMVMSVCASPADVMAGRLFSGQDGLMLSKMLLAIDVDIRDVYFNSWLKDLPDFNPQPPTETVQAATSRVQTEWQLSGAKAILLTGKFFERADVLAKVRQIWREECCFQIPHPQQIINNPQLKRGAWETLQQLQRYLS